MLKVYDQNHRPIGWLVTYTNYKISSEIDTGDKTLSFEYTDAGVELANEFYIRNRTDEYVIKKIKKSSNRSSTVECVLNLEELEGIPIEAFSVTSETLYRSANLAIQGSGWTVDVEGSDIDGTIRKNAGVIDTTALGVVQTLATAWMCEVRYDSIAKTITFRNKFGSDKGCYLATGLNLKKLDKETDSYEFYTAIYPIGADGLTIESVNSGVKELTDFTYSNKKKTFLWKDETYTDPLLLKTDAKAYLEDLAVPKESLSCDLIDLAKQSSRYSVFAFDLGDTVTIIDPGTKTRAKHRIVKLDQYPHEPWKNSCELANRKVRFTDMIDAKKKAEEISTYVVEGAGQGTISLSKLLNEYGRRLNQGGL